MTSVVDQEFFNVTLNYLSIPTLRLLSTLLNPLKIIPTKENLPRDWRGLADLTGCTSEEASMFNYKSDPTLNILKKWCSQEMNSIRLLLLYFQKLDRFDVYDDAIPLIVSDIQSHKIKTCVNIDTSLFITSKDQEHYQKGLPAIQYDASVLYAEEDLQFAEEIVTALESKYEYKLEIFMKDRDLIGGSIKHDATMKIIANRCNRLIIILSPAFLQSSENKYFISFAQSIGIEQRQRKIVPCLYKACEVPVELKPLHSLKYTRAAIFGDFFDKLYSSVIPAHLIAKRAMQNTSQLCIETASHNTLTVPDIASKQERQHSSLPNLDQTDEKIQESDSQSVTSSHSEEKKIQSKKSKVSHFIQKKILKKKPKALMAA